MIASLMFNFLYFLTCFFSLSEFIIVPAIVQSNFPAVHFTLFTQVHIVADGLIEMTQTQSAYSKWP